MQARNNPTFDAGDSVTHRIASSGLIIHPLQSLKKSKSASLFTPAAYLGSELSRRSTHSGDLKLRGVYFHRRRIWERG